MTLIRVENLVKEFRRPVRKKGPFGGLRTLVTRDYETTRAVDGISLAVDEGELVGYLGANGAGKSTSVKILAGILAPTSGEVRVGGVVPSRERTRNAMQIGVVFGQRSQLWWDLPLIESFRLLATMYRLPPARYRANLDYFTDVLDLKEFLHSPVRQLSLGQRMRADLAAAMLHEPRVLYLDEPTIGLDVVVKENVRAMIERANRTLNTTILLATHDMADIERLCDRIVVIDRGRIDYDGALTTLMTRFAPYRELRVRVVGGSGPVDPALPGVTVHDGHDGLTRLRYDPARTSTSELIRQVTTRYEVDDLRVVEPELEDVVRGLYERGR
jgi:viologen exporter family transport system ATP-binding protein